MEGRDLFLDLAKMMQPFCTRCAVVDFLLAGEQGIGKSRTALLGHFLRKRICCVYAHFCTNKNRVSIWRLIDGQKEFQKFSLPPLDGSLKIGYIPLCSPFVGFSLFPDVRCIRVFLSLPMHKKGPFSGAVDFLSILWI